METNIEKFAETKGKIKELEAFVEQKLNLIDDRVLLIRSARQKPTDLSIDEYVWLIFARSIYLQAKDINTLLVAHRDDTVDTSVSIPSIFRSVLEDHFRLKLLFADLGKTHTHLSALLLSNIKKNKTHLEALKKLAQINKFIFFEDPNLVLSAEGMQRKIDEYNQDILDSKQGKDATEIERLSKIYGSVEQVCMEYDKVKGIDRVYEGKENDSLAWQYNYIYRHLSTSVHGRLEHKEKIFSDLWQNPESSNREHYLNIIVSLEIVLNQTFDMYPNISKLGYTDHG